MCEPSSFLIFSFRPSSAEIEEEFENRVQTKALWTYNYFDWSKIPKPSEIRYNRDMITQPEILSVSFK